jgi:diguanylate cyclase (GGDEF)-like protein
MDKPTPLRMKLAQLRNSFTAALPARLEDATRSLALIKSHPTDPANISDLHLVMHSLKGTGNSLGFADLGQIAARGEDLAGLLLEKLSATEDLVHELEGCVAQMALAVERIGSGDAVLADDARHPRYELPTHAKPGGVRQDKLIYICDDEPLHLALIAGQLLCYGYLTEQFSTTAALREALKTRQPALLIMDIMFPGGSSEGTDVLQALRPEVDPFPVVYVSARTDFDARLNAIRAGGEAYFPKPVNTTELVAVLDRLISCPAPEPFKVLIVDDEPEVAQLHSSILQQAGMNTEVTCEAGRVLDLVAQFRPDLVLMDMYMPKCSGREVAKLIRQVPECISLPIVFLSCETDKSKQFSAMRIGADGFLTKPIDPEELVMSVGLRAERMRILRSLMARDSLTGLFNHTTTTQLLDSSLSAARRGGSHMSFAMLDLDNFKAVNDTYGHPAGDQVLLALARVLRQRLRKSDLIGRYGGEEFAVIMNDVGPDKAEQLMDELRAFFSRVVINVGEVQFSCTFSCGIANYPDLDNVERLRDAADQALYQAKHSGRNRVVTYRAK